MEEKEKNDMERTQSLFSKHGKAEFFVLLILGIVVGVIVKENISSRVTMGYEDYMIEKNVQSYDYAKMTKEVVEKAKAEEKEAAANGGGESQGTMNGAACGA
ncbi:MAG: hypothetical protein IPN70_00730 [Candidatus Moraniibacteriota bacterium]|nr:MAG: hypothetical protein IPN70_00730 [Candidatus Moranbacteria bacterium]